MSNCSKTTPNQCQQAESNPQILELLTSVQALVDGNVATAEKLEMRQEFERNLQLQIDDRFKKIEGMLTNCIQSVTACIEASQVVANSPVEIKTKVASFDDFHAGDSGLSTASFLGNWQKQRDEMLNQFSKAEATFENTSTDKQPAKKTDITCSSEVVSESDLKDLGATVEDVNEILLLKEQLQQAMRETEIELSIQRAKISQERAALEDRESRLVQRERDVERRVSEKNEKSKGRNVFRLQSFLGKKEEPIEE